MTIAHRQALAVAYVLLTCVVSLAVRGRLQSRWMRDRTQVGRDWWDLTLALVLGWWLVPMWLIIAVGERLDRRGPT